LNRYRMLIPTKREGVEQPGFKPVSSSMLRRVRYDPNSQFLDVVFRTGETYRYKDVPLDEYNKLMKAESHGKYMQCTSSTVTRR
jgi:hypothetical protein